MEELFPFRRLFDALPSANLKILKRISERYDVSIPLIRRITVHETAYRLCLNKVPLLPNNPPLLRNNPALLENNFSRSDREGLPLRPAGLPAPTRKASCLLRHNSDFGNRRNIGGNSEEHRRHSLGAFLVFK